LAPLAILWRRFFTQSGAGADRLNRSDFGIQKQKKGFLDLSNESISAGG
jgi:hypothetical protein